VATIAAVFTRASGVFVRQRPLAAAGGGILALVAAAAAPSSPLLPGPNGAPAVLLAAVLLAGAFLIGLRWPVHTFFGLVALTVLEGVIRRWVVNDVTVFLLKDFLLLGLYAAVLPRLPREQLRRPWWLLAPIVGSAALALVLVPRSAGLSQPLIGMRAYLIYVPLLWAAPAVLSARRRAFGLLALVASLAIVESVLAVVQAFSGSGGVNKLVSGAVPGYITLNGLVYQRPAGTFMQVGVLAAFLFFGILVAFALVASFRRGKLLALGSVAPAFIAGGIVYSSARSLFGSALLALLGLAVLLLARRRALTLATVVTCLAIGLAAVVFIVPWAVGRPVGSGYLGRAADFNTAGGKVGLWSSRVRPQLQLIGAQRIVGHGPGSMTLGTEYANPNQKFLGEGEYTKLAWELGWPGLVLFVWLVLALIFATIRGALHARDWQRPLALVGMCAAVLLPLWYALTFALDFPVVALLLWTFAGCAVTYGVVGVSRSEANRDPIESHVRQVS
jgi:hypothetical protein